MLLQYLLNLPCFCSALISDQNNDDDDDDGTVALL